MSDSNLGVAITADITDLQTKLALAQSEFRNSNKELRGLADQMTAAGEAGNDNLLPALQAAAASSAAAKAEIAGLNAELRGTAESSNEASSGLIRIRENLETFHASISQVSGAASALGELFLVGFGIERLSEFVMKSAELGEEMIRTSQKTGIAVEALSALKFAAETNGVSFDNLQTGLKKLSASIQESLVTPSSKAALGFKQLGIDTDFLREHQNDLEAVLRKVADAYAAHADGAAKSSNATAIMGRGGTELITVLNQGADGLDKMKSKAEELGAVMSTETAERLEEIKQKATALNLAWGTFAANITAAIAPALTDLMNGINGVFAAANRGPLDQLKATEQFLVQTIHNVRESLDNPGVFDQWALDTDKQRRRLAELELKLRDVREQIVAMQGASTEGVPKPKPKPDLPAMDNGKPETSTDINEEKELTKELEAELAERAQAQIALQKEVDADYAAGIKEKYDNERELTAAIQAEDVKRAKLQKDITKEWETAFAPITRAFDQSVNGMIAGTLTFQNAVANMGQSILAEFVNTTVQTAARWAATELAKTAATAAGVASREATEQAGMAAGAAAHAASAQTSILTAAYEAAANAYQSAAAIPYVGWILGPIAAAGAFVAVEAFGASVPSAAGGWDLPSSSTGIPMIGHSREMMLPAPIADKVRNMTDGGSGGDQHFHTTVHVANSNASPEDIAAGVQAAYRSFNPALRNKNRRKR